MKRDPKSRPILVLDEDPQTLELMLEPLRWEGYDVRGLTSATEASEFLNYWKPQLIIVDPEFSNQDGLKYLNSLAPFLETTGLIIVSSENSTERISECLDMGASDYILSPFVPMEFLARVRAQLRFRDAKEDLLEANHQLQELVEIDDLTGLFNMRSIFSKLEFEMERGKRFNRPVTVVMIDMDHFKSVNDGHDHLFGSYVLSEVGKIIKTSTRTVDIPARYGGDEFLIVLSETPLAGIEQFCERLRARIEHATFSQGKDSIKLTISMGFATSTLGEPIAAKELVRKADMALYEAKRRGRNQVCAYKPEIDRNTSLDHSAVIDIFDKKRKTA
ncbi:MAG: diguanylate cyclase response regulator [Bdellovibrionales bacterium RIFCSPHIGHO2_01_FULL_40_29]|nr:MAG: diguanylate cyclase response regulator [Bdellovibrionales bacterium RIFCSPHIGHO2_01_FULL_40_29]OFZ35125.1 MAG: diguanylate cyclase response regulator [Bdellovibrionales bacterium RIFCSPHIGHO2_02_FULL_40_15]